MDDQDKPPNNTRLREDHRWPNEEGIIGRNSHYEPRNSSFRLTQRSSTARGNETTANDNKIAYGSTRYDDGDWDYSHDPRHNGLRLDERPARLVKFKDRDSAPLSTHPYLYPSGREASDQSLALVVREKLGSPIPINQESELVAYRQPPITAVESSWRAANTGHDNIMEHPPPQHIPGLFQTIFDVNNPRDASIHLELLITDDYDKELETFSRLQRLGNFSEAQEFFCKHLDPYLSNPYVFVQFGQMLLNEGDYLAFDRLNSDAVFGKENRMPPAPQLDLGEGTVRVVKDCSRSRSSSRDPNQEEEEHISGGPRSGSHHPGADARSTRRGRFDSVERIVRIRARSLSQGSVVSIQHYHEAGQDDDSNRIHLENLKHEVNRISERRRMPVYDELELLRQNWRLLKATSTAKRTGRLDDAFTEAWYTIENFRFGRAIGPTEIAFGSTEIQVVALTLNLCAEIGRVAPERYYSGLRQSAEKWIDWSSRSKELLVQGRIWDFKDLYVAATAAFSLSSDALFFGSGDLKPSLIDDWVLDENDESTNLAQLELLLGLFQPHLTTWSLTTADSRAEMIRTKSPLAMKSRGFIRWIIAKVSDTLSSEGNDPWVAYEANIRDFHGMRWPKQSRWCAPSLYIPRNSENPGWVPPEYSMSMAEPLQLALNLAKELKDYASQVLCYRSLIYQSPDPISLFQELAHLQMSDQGDKQGHLETLLTSYLVCHDRPSKQKLLDELQQTDDWGDATVLCDRPIYWARDFIERALKRSLEGPKSTATLRHPAVFYVDRGLPWEAEHFTWLNAGMDGHPSSGIKEYSPHAYRHQMSSSSLPDPNPLHMHQKDRPLSASGPLYPSRADALGQEAVWPGGLPPPPGFQEWKLQQLEREHVAGVAKEEEQAEKRLLTKDNKRQLKDRVQLGTRFIQRSERSPSPPLQMDRTAVLELGQERKRENLHSPPCREQITIPSPPPPPSPPLVLRGPTIERDVITHYRDIDHGLIQAQPFSPPSSPPPPTSKIEKQGDREQETRHYKDLIMRDTLEKMQQSLRDQQDRDLQGRLDRVESSLRDQSERLKSAEDRVDRRQSKGRSRASRTKRRNGVVAENGHHPTSYYYSYGPTSWDGDDCTDDSVRGERRESVNETRKSDSDRDSEDEASLDGMGKYRPGGTGRRSGSRLDEADRRDGDYTTSPPQIPGTAPLVMQGGIQLAADSTAGMAESPRTSSPIPPVTELEANCVDLTMSGAMRRRFNNPTSFDFTPDRKQAPTAEKRRYHFRDIPGGLVAEPEKTGETPDSNLNADFAKLDEDGVTSSQGVRPREDRGGTRQEEQNEGANFSTPFPRNSTASSEPKRKGDYGDDKSTNERKRREGRLPGRASTHTADVPLGYFEDTATGDRLEQIRLSTSPKKSVEHTGSSHKQEVRARSRSRPPPTLESKGIQPLERRKTWQEKRFSYQGRLQAPMRRSSLVVDADGRPQAVRAATGHRRSYLSYTVPDMSSAASGSERAVPRPRSQAAEGGGVTLRGSGPASGVSGRLLTRKLEGEKNRLSTGKIATSSLLEQSEERVSSQPDLGHKAGESSTAPVPWEPKQGISRKSTVADAETDEE